MKKEKSGIILAIINTIGFIAMVTINALSEILPLGGVTNAEVSDMYPTLFTPVGLTFGIWGLIYVMLAFYTVRQFIGDGMKLTKEIGPLYITSSILNIGWIFAWHYSLMIPSFLIILALLFVLWEITKYTKDEDIWTESAFGVYFGWITVATIANGFVTFSAIVPEFHESGLEVMLATVAIIVAGVCGAYRFYSERDFGYAVTIVWSLMGIIMAQAANYIGEYIVLIIAALIGILLIGISMVVPEGKITELLDDTEIIKAKK